MSSGSECTLGECYCFAKTKEPRNAHQYEMHVAYVLDSVLTTLVAATTISRKAMLEAVKERNKIGS